MEDQYYILIHKLDQFVRKYYKNQLIRGGIYCLSLLLIFYLLANTIEYFGRFDSLTRTIIFYVFLLLNLGILVKFIFIPIFKLLKIGKLISHEDAASIIGSHFSDVSDKLLNTLQLKHQYELDQSSSALISASIDQKIKELKPVPFKKAIDFSVNKKYIKYPIGPVLLLIGILLISPSLITEPTNRLVNHTTEYEQPLPFHIKLANTDMNVIQHEDFDLEVLVEGEEVPDHVLLISGNNQTRLKKESATTFSHRFINVQKNLTFKLAAGGYNTSNYEINVLPKPLILDFQVSLNYPSYTGKKDESVKNNGDFMVPAGTVIDWEFYTKNTDRVKISFEKETIDLEEVSTRTFSHEKKFFRNTAYSITTSNEFLQNADSLAYSISVVPDGYPVILAEEVRDSVFDKRFYFKGVIKDDYGFRLLTFNLIENEGGLSHSDTIPIQKNIIPQQYYHSIDLANFDLRSGEQVSYYFEIWDNDGVNGSKSTKSQILSFQLPTLAEVEKEKEESNESIKEDLEQTRKDLEDLQKEMDEIAKKMVDKKELSWEDKEQIKELMDKQEEILSKMEQIKELNKSKALKEQQYKEVNQELLDKQKKLEELFDKLMENEELKDLFDELRELMEENNKDKINEMMEDMKMSNEELEKMLDRNLELFKQFEFEQKLDETIDKLDQMAKDQEELSEESLDKDNETEDLQQKQEDLNSEFQELKEDLEMLDELNKELEEPNKFDPLEEEQEQVEEEMSDSQEQMENNKRKKASESQKNAAQKMQEMSKSMTAMQQEMIQEGTAEDIDALRDILENLIQVSFDQEELIEKVNNTKVNDPRYTSLIQEQDHIKDDMAMVEDSLFALSKRQIMIEPFISKEIKAINQNFDRSITYLNNRQPQQASSRQQFVMTSVNNLALMLSETLDQMMQSSAMSNSSCKNPGQSSESKGQNSMKSVRQLQEQLNKQLEMMKSGQERPGKEKDGKQGQGQSSMSEQLARSAAQQEYIRNELRKMAEQMDAEGEYGAGKELKKIAEDMEKTETDLVNKMLTDETLMRQKQILTRMLKSEKADMEREKEEKRESAEGKNVFLRNPDELFKYKKVQKSASELLQPVPAGLTPFYKDKVNQYFFNFEELLDQ